MTDITTTVVVAAAAWAASIDRQFRKNNLKCKTLCLGIPDNFVEHGTQEEIYKLCGLDKNSIIKKIVKQLQ